MNLELQSFINGSEISTENRQKRKRNRQAVARSNEVLRYSWGSEDIWVMFAGFEVGLLFTVTLTNHFMASEPETNV